MQAGDHAAAQIACQEFLEQQPEHAAATYLLGLCFLAQNDFPQAIAAFGQTIAARPDFAFAHSNLGNALYRSGRMLEALNSFRTAVSLNPSDADAHNNIGLILQSQGRTVDAIAAYRTAIAARGDMAEAHFNLSNALRAEGDLNAGLSAARMAVQLRGTWPEAHNNLGILLHETGDFPQAIAAFTQAISLEGNYSAAHGNLGNVFRQIGQITDAVNCYRRAVALDGSSAIAHANLGNALRQLGQLDAAAESLGRAIALQADLAEAHNNLGNVRKDQARLDEAITCYRSACELSPGDPVPHSNWIYTLLFHRGYDARDILHEHRRWNQRHAAGLREDARPCRAAPSGNGRRLRVGYVSPDFRDHCQALFTIPLLSHHDHENFEIFCYSDVAVPDAITDRIRGCVDVWRSIVGRGDAAVAELIRSDEIDVLVDLTVHMSNHRLLVFARRAAPIQITWLGYPGTTGMSAMDFRVSDPHLDPPESDNSYSEKTVCLPDSFWCYDPLCDSPAVNDLPADGAGHITFGSLNNFCKINEATLDLWSTVMSAVPESRLVLLAPGGSARQWVRSRLNRNGVSSDRVEFFDRRPRLKYLELFHRIDIALDTFPYNGHTTSLDSFWMGVPVVTRFGRTAVSRGGYSQLMNLNLPELCAADEKQFVQIALNLGGDLPRLRVLRSTLRQRLMQSPLTDGVRFAQSMERIFRDLAARGDIPVLAA